jgi:hypothetical protein
MIVAGLTGAWLWWRGRLFSARWYLWPARSASDPTRAIASKDFFTWAGNHPISWARYSDKLPGD